VCSNKFRINANGNNIDVWLIYKCKNCDTTWNMEIFSRIKPQQIEKSLYLNFAKNDPTTAMEYAYNQSILSKNKAVALLDDIEYAVEKVNLRDIESGLEIVSEFGLGLRIDRFLSEELRLPRIKVKLMLESGAITFDGVEISPKTKIKGTMRLRGVFSEEAKQVPQHEQFA
jgi:hypothetical protein